jgi:LPS-assembly protein
MRPAAVLLALASLAWSFFAEDSHAQDRTPRRVGNSDTPVVFRANEVQYDQDLGLIVAKGAVELNQGNETLLADTVTYNQRTDTVTASGNVSILQPTGDIVFADFTELSGDMRDGFIKNVKLLLSDRSRMVGNTARRVGGTRTEIRRGVYSPCELCEDDPRKPPVWQIKAEQIIHDKELQIVEYRDAVMEIDGIPILYAPYFSHPDPSVKRQSGFLPPVFGYGNTLGFHTTIPYYWVLGPDKDATIRPTFTTSAGVVLDLQYRQRFSNGQMENDGSVEAGSGRQSASAANVGPPTGNVRGHIFGTGEWDLNDDWRTGYQAQRASDQTYMLRYHFATPSNFLTSRLFAEDFPENAYGAINAYAFQSLNPLLGDSQEPIVLPVVDYTWMSQPDKLGSRFEFSGNAFDMLRRTGPEVRRVSGTADWRLPFNGPVGDRFTLDASVRTDGYYSDHVALTPNSTTAQNDTGTTVLLLSNAGTTTALAGRVFPQLSLKWRYPWVRSGLNGNALIEPIVAVIAGPNGENPARIPAEDSQGFEFDEMSLFVPNRLPGYDRVDSGQRVDYGLHGELRTKMLGDWNALVGESFRFQHSDIFLPGSGLEDRLSDIVGAVTATPSDMLSFAYRFRLDKSGFGIRREEAEASGGPASFRAKLRYVSISPGASDPTQPGGNQLSAGIDAELTRYWSISVNDTKFIGGTGATINAGAALTYRDDCFAVIGSINQSGVRVGDVHPGVSVLLTVVFKNLGEVGEKVFSAN